VLLLWCQNDDHVTVAVTDAKTGEAFQFPLRDGARPPEVFHHPYTHAGRPQHRRVPIVVSRSS
jgi:hypothetical protein